MWMNLYRGESVSLAGALVLRSWALPLAVEWGPLEDGGLWRVRVLCLCLMVIYGRR